MRPYKGEYGPKPSEYIVLKEEDAELLKQVLADKIKLWNKDVKPNVIVLTATSSAMCGMIIKYAWEKLYYEKTQPKFLFIDPKRIKGYTAYGENAKPREESSNPMVSANKLNSSDTVLVFDEFSSGRLDRLSKYRPGYPNALKYKSQGHKGNASLYLAAEYVSQQGVQNIWTDSVGVVNGEKIHELSDKYTLLQRDFYAVPEKKYDWKKNVSGNNEHNVSLIKDLKRVASEIAQEAKENYE